MKPLLIRVLQRLVRRLPSFRGKLRLGRLLWNHVSGSVVLSDRHGFVYEIPDVRETLGLHLAVNGVYEPTAQNVLLKCLPRGGVFVDVGANIGVFTLPAASRVGLDGKVVAIEASPEIAKVLSRNISANGLRNVHLINAAAGAAEGVVEFYPAPSHHFGMGSRAPQFDATPITVASVALDTVLDELGIGRVDAMKIDVEGYEADALAGANRLLSGENPPLIVFEFLDWAEARISLEHVGAAQRLLLNHGFRIWRLSDYPAAPPLKDIVLVGGEMLVATRVRDAA